MKVLERVGALLFGMMMLTTTIPGCNRNLISGSKLTLSNYNQVTTGMTKEQVDQILGPPTSIETKDMLIFKKTTWAYEDGNRFAMITFRNDEVEGKETNLGTQEDEAGENRLRSCRRAIVRLLQSATEPGKRRSGYRGHE